jgi:protein TonB
MRGWLALASSMPALLLASAVSAAAVGAAPGARDVPPPPESGARNKPNPLTPPVYPFREAVNCIGGLVMLAVEIDETGKIVDVSVRQSSGNRALDKAAVTAANGWGYLNPGTRDGVRVGGIILFPIQFTPPDCALKS